MSLTVYHEVEGRAGLLHAGQSVPHEAGVGDLGVAEVSPEDVEVTRRQHVEFSI